MDNKIYDYLTENGYDIDADYNGICLDLIEDEILIKGSKSDLIELANYIVNVALSDNEKDHLHLDDLTLINKDSNISNLIIEKE